MRIKALAIRILWQLRGDKRTLALMLFAPILVLTLVYLVLDGAVSQVTIAVTNVPSAYVQALDHGNTIVLPCTENEAMKALETGEVTAAARIDSGKLSILLDGSESQKAQMAVQVLTNAKNEMDLAGQSMSRSDLSPEIFYVYGYEDLSNFDHYGSILIGFIIFFFVFLVAGISFLQERSLGTLEKLLSMPIHRWEIVVGYVLGFGLFTVLQSLLVSAYVVYVLDVMMVGSFGLVILITLMTAITALTLGILLSTAANNEFQMIQFIPIVIVPQVFFSGMFELSPGMELVGKAMPLSYVADALKQVMIKGAGISDIMPDLLVLIGYSLLFMAANTLVLKRYRKI